MEHPKPKPTDVLNKVAELNWMLKAKDSVYMRQ